MPTYFFSRANDSPAANNLEDRVLAAIPQVRRIDSIEELTKGMPKSPEGEKTYIILPLSPQNHGLERVTKIASQYRDVLFFIFVSEEISASDYKRLVRTGNADWVSTPGAPQE